MPDFEIKVGDDDPVLQGILRDGFGDAIDLTGATLALRLTHIRGGTAIDDAATNDQALDLELFPDTKGTWHFDLGEVEIDAGGYHLELTVTYPDGDQQTFPTRGYNTVAIYERLATP